MEKVLIEVYKIEELNEKAKQKAIYDHNLRMWDFVCEDLKEGFKDRLLNNYGIDVEDIYFSLSHCQGDGMAFTGYIKESKISEILNKKYDGLSAYISHTGRYSHEYSMSIDLNDLEEELQEDEFEKIENELLNYIRNVSVTLKSFGYNFVSEQESEENAIYYFTDNNYLFYDDGEVYSKY